MTTETVLAVAVCQGTVVSRSALMPDPSTREVVGSGSGRRALMKFTETVTT